MSRRSLCTVIVMAAAWLAVACLDISSPVTGISSITSVLLPTPSVVVNDSLRDTLGVTKPLAVHAFGANGEMLPDEDITVRYFAIDSTLKLHVDSITGFAWGDSLSPLAKVVARVTPTNGKGIVQTLQVPLPVVPTPVAATKSDALLEFPFNPTTLDTLGAGVLSPSLDVKVVGDNDTPIQSYVVSYKIVRMPAPRVAGEPTVRILDRSGNDSTIAITSSSGVASRQLRVRLTAISPEVLLGTGTDTVVVQVQVRYRQQLLTVTPSDSFKLVLRSKS